MGAPAPDDGETVLPLATTKQMDVRGVSVVWNTETDNVPVVTYHGCASPYEAIGLMLVGLLDMAQQYNLPIDDIDEDEEEEGD